MLTKLSLPAIGLLAAALSVLLAMSFFPSGALHSQDKRQVLIATVPKAPAIARTQTINIVPPPDEPVAGSFFGAGDNSAGVWIKN